MITILTPTGGRPEALKVLAGCINKQEYREPIRWIVCDDCEPASVIPPMRGWITLDVVRPTWRWELGDNTQARSMEALLSRVSGDQYVVIMEDDDYYAPGHLAHMQSMLESSQLVGQRVSLYYNVSTRRFKELPGLFHASLGASAFRGRAIRELADLCGKQGSQLDIAFWRQFDGVKTLSDSRTAVGIKGLPGRAGIGVGHRPSFGAPDPNGDVLRDWVGVEAAAEYRWLARRP